MAEKTTIARPYAQAVFELARSQNAMPRWSEALVIAAALVKHQDMGKLIGNPRVDQNEVVQLFLQVCGAKLDKDGQNFIKLLMENNRLTLLPEIAELYEAYRAEAESTLEAEMISAFPVESAQQEKIIEVLKKRTGRSVTLKSTIDKSLVGGALIRAGDLVIDGTVRGQLAKLAAVMSR